VTDPRIRRVPYDREQVARALALLDMTLPDELGALDAELDSSQPRIPRGHVAMPSVVVKGAGIHCPWEYGPGPADDSDSSLASRMFIGLWGDVF
jgi:hypothetical protein